MLVSPRQFWGFASPVNTCCSASPADGWFSAGPARWLTSLEGGPEPDVGCLGATGTAVLPPHPEQVLCVGCRLQDPLSHFHSLVTWQLLVSPLCHSPERLGDLLWAITLGIGRGRMFTQVCLMSETCSESLVPTRSAQEHGGSP